MLSFMLICMNNVQYHAIEYNMILSLFERREGYLHLAFKVQYVVWRETSLADFFLLPEQTNSWFS